MNTACSDCGAGLDIVGDRVTEKLAVIPAVYYVIRYVHRKGVCPCCNDKIVVAPAEPSLIPKSQATPEILAHIAISKVLDALPIYRQEKQADRSNLPINRDKMVRWMIALGNQLTPFIKLLEYTYNSYKVGGIDETKLQVILEESRKAQQLSFLFIRYGGSPNTPVMLVDYRKRKDYNTIKQILDPFEGECLVSDMNPSYIKHANENDDVTLYACHDHARRKFTDALSSVPKHGRDESLPGKVIWMYGHLYKIEAQIKGKSPRQIKRMRRKSRKWLNKIYNLITSESFRPTSKFGEACQYMLNHKNALYAYLDNPLAPISNIMSEHIAKKIAVTRKNFLFCFSETGAHTLANVMTVVYTASLYKDHNLHDYLTVLFLELPKAKTMDQLDALLPWNITPQQVANIVRTRPRPTIISSPLVA